MQSAERAGEGRFPRAVAAGDGDHVSGRGLQGKRMENRPLLIGQGHVLQREDRGRMGRGKMRGALLRQIRGP